MSARITIWEPGRSWRNAVMVPLFVGLSPILIPVILISRLFDKPVAMTPETFERLLTVLIEDGPDFDSVMDDLNSFEFADPALEALRKEALSVPALPWSGVTIAQLKEIRARARALGKDGISA